ncbi:hypothetical protein CONCODRAFT_74494 [Conidiobolus coronatus NRRL 28638]|uniref:Uncharacterized protein n=1 Tax=Conidiobolus coronatus (strain ATCC 28846 / CBS 209.66 / NRRL 28638) TaxID=796925 RepID=A0A137NQK9_CONC2|nr:hypothetical protein CONCODRAFT_74494 [Conidiobolus coronatus NRRL 28638]|eukprot:KXN65047.1 hypothetical protein CONCODRAFT_74494 [Conidiobolus coronatus NRRL 28638]
MRQYILEEFPAPRNISGEELPSHMQKEIFPPGTVVTAILTSREDRVPPEVSWCSTKIDIELVNPKPKIPYQEELFFRIIEYLLPPRDRYLVERVDKPNLVCLPTHQEDKEVDIVLNEEMLEALMGEELWDGLRIRKNNSRILKKSLEANEISVEEYSNRIDAIQEEYNKAKELARKKYNLGQNVKTRCRLCTHSYVITKSEFLKVGDTMTIKRKNIHFIKDIIPTKIIFDIPRYLTTWSGNLLPPSARNYISIGHLVRCGIRIGDDCGAFYFVLVDRLPDDQFLGVFVSLYVMDDFWYNYVGTYSVIKKEYVSEIPHDFMENKPIQSVIEKLKRNYGLTVTGYTAFED